MSDQLECRIVVIYHRGGKTFSLGMYDPRTTFYAPLGDKHPMYPMAERERIIYGLRERIEKERHLITYCERSE